MQINTSSHFFAQIETHLFATSGALYQWRNQSSGDGSEISQGKTLVEWGPSQNKT